jgi:hypothetical protein
LNSSHYSPEKTNGMNFAVPIDVVCRIVGLLREGKDPAPPVLQFDLGTTLNEGELVIAQVDDALADKLKVGDRITAVRKPGEAHPYVIGSEGVGRYLKVMSECAKAQIARLRTPNS